MIHEPAKVNLRDALVIANFPVVREFLVDSDSHKILTNNKKLIDESSYLDLFYQILEGKKKQKLVEEKQKQNLKKQEQIKNILHSHDQNNHELVQSKNYEFLKKELEPYKLASSNNNSFMSKITKNMRDKLLSILRKSNIKIKDDSYWSALLYKLGIEVSSKNKLDSFAENLKFLNFLDDLTSTHSFFLTNKDLIIQNCNLPSKWPYEAEFCDKDFILFNSDTTTLVQNTKLISNKIITKKCGSYNNLQLKLGYFIASPAVKNSLEDIVKICNTSWPLGHKINSNVVPEVCDSTLLFVIQLNNLGYVNLKFFSGGLVREKIPNILLQKISDKLVLAANKLNNNESRAIYLLNNISKQLVFDFSDLFIRPRTLNQLVVLVIIFLFWFIFFGITGYKILMSIRLENKTQADKKQKTIKITNVDESYLCKEKLI